MMVVIDFRDGPRAAPDPPHSHPHEQITYVAAGEIIFFLDGRPTRLGPGDITTIPSGVPHCVSKASMARSDRSDLAKGLPWAEIICGVWLMIGFLTPLASLISFILLWGFTAAVVSTFLRGKRVDCGCFGQQINPQTNRTRWTVAYRNLGLMGIPDSTRVPSKSVYSSATSPTVTALITWLCSRACARINPASTPRI